MEAAEIDRWIDGLPEGRPVLIAGPTASGKSALALRIAERAGGTVVNADALQVFAGWEVLTAQPSAADRARAPHALYGHLPHDAPYSVGHWLREVRPLLDGGSRPIVVGGTGLYLSALTEGLAEIPPVPAEVRAEADALPLPALVAGLDARTAGGIDLANRARVQRAWEVRRATGRGLAEWQAETPPPLLPPEAAERLVLGAPKDWLEPRLVRRFDAMLSGGALDEARAMRPRWDPALLSSKAIGARELIAFLGGETTLEDARESALIQTRRYAKRQRTWFRARMGDWRRVDLSTA
ncbi:tRNA (adenosine(37)-N6)-dimethylallyltransferase MiaA [Wenxinia marina]|uniref:tRNA dimethylallyltransferase n=1 Tax=Wenxinia marina DSM 24838 TaxID=1123501 RepID=A0A0D0PZG3_9RHOB|nr:tRNA (adenosine(37)-N6)-dimethylallyltransferase MiaA [Wenxinia marina]KIQ67729.1 tRNA dimethylallyltransferase [Wenxinia marina DSM 24838]GGL77631.1 tRNA dimethylallyltransferase [Wenxinia marina]